MKMVIIGAGNIATHYAIAFHTLGHTISQVYNRTLANAEALANVVSAQAIATIAQLDPAADLYIIAVSDAHISSVVAQLPPTIKGIVVHTSGATTAATLQKLTHYGVIYPPQSLTKAVVNDLSQIPFAVEGSSKETAQLLLHLLQEISPRAFICDSRQRLALHVAAVFANNFSNILFDIAQGILSKENLDFELIKPIIMETAEKVQNHAPHAVQTGPAVRNDVNTINTHLQFLSYSNNLSEIYQLLTEFIIKSRQK